MSVPERMLTDREVAQKYGITARETVWRWARRGLIPMPRQGPGSIKRWLESEIDADIRQREVAQLKQLAS